MRQHQHYYPWPGLTVPQAIFRFFEGTVLIFGQRQTPCNLFLDPLVSTAEVRVFNKLLHNEHEDRNDPTLVVLDTMCNSITIDTFVCHTERMARPKGSLCCGPASAFRPAKMRLLQTAIRKKKQPTTTTILMASSSPQPTLRCSSVDMVSILMYSRINAAPRLSGRVASAITLGTLTVRVSLCPEKKRAHIFLSQTMEFNQERFKHTLVPAM